VTTEVVTVIASVMSRWPGWHPRARAAISRGPLSRCEWAADSDSDGDGWSATDCQPESRLVRPDWDPGHRDIWLFCIRIDLHRVNPNFLRSTVCWLSWAKKFATSCTTSTRIGLHASVCHLPTLSATFQRATQPADSNHSDENH
jgi:hypothetical protein